MRCNSSAPFTFGARAATVTELPYCTRVLLAES
jgi:hypothetical protein